MNLVAVPILIPLVTASLLLLVRGRRARGVVGIAGAAGSFLTSIALLPPALEGEVRVLQMAAWAAPYGITLVVDGLAAWMLTLGTFVGLLTMVFAASSLRHAPRRGESHLLNRAREAFGHHALLHFLFMGVNMSFLTGDVFNLFVAFEVMLIASYGLILLGGELPQLREGFKYVVINLVASALFVVTAGLCYGLFGTLNMADIAGVAAEHAGDPRIPPVALLLAIVFTTKAAMFPFGFWLPNSYPAPAAATSAFLAAVLTKVGVYALLRVATLMFPGLQVLTTTVLALSAVTMLFGAFGLIARHRWRHAMAMANVASVGYILFGAVLGTVAGLGAALYYIAHSILVVFTLFVVAALAEKIAGGDVRAEGHLARYPWLGVGYFTAALALAGLPPTSGFIGKFGLIRSLFALEGGLTLAVAIVAVVAGFLLLYGSMQVWRTFFWGESDAVHVVPLPAPMRAVLVVAVGALVALALASGPIYRSAEAIATSIVAQGNAAYIAAVLSAEGRTSAAADDGTHGVDVPPAGAVAPSTGLDAEPPAGPPEGESPVGPPNPAQDPVPEPGASPGEAPPPEGVPAAAPEGEGE